MGLGASQARLLELTKRKDDLEFEMQRIEESRTNLAALPILQAALVVVLEEIKALGG